MLLTAHEQQGRKNTLLYVPAANSRPCPSAARTIVEELNTLLERRAPWDEAQALKVGAVVPAAQPAEA